MSLGKLHKLKCLDLNLGQVWSYKVSDLIRVLPNLTSLKINNAFCFIDDIFNSIGTLKKLETLELRDQLIETYLETAEHFQKTKNMVRIDVNTFIGNEGSFTLPDKHDAIILVYLGHSLLKIIIYS